MPGCKSTLSEHQVFYTFLKIRRRLRSLALPKDGQPDLCQCSIGPGVRRTTLKVNSFCCSFSHRWPGVGRTQRECSVGVCDKNSLPSWPSEHSYPWGQRCQQGLLCRMTAKRWANAFAGGALIVLCVLGRGGQSTAQKPNYKLPCCKPVWVVLSDRRFIRIHQARVFERLRCLLCLSILSFGHVSSQKDCQTVCKNCNLWLEVYVLVCAVSSSIAFRFSLRWRKFERTRACLVACDCASVLLGFKLTCFHWKIGWIVDDSCR